MSSKLFIGNLNYTTGETELRGVFEGGGFAPVSVTVVADRETGRSRGFGFVEFGSPEEAGKAMEALNGTEIDGRELRIDLAKDRPRR